MMNDRLDAEIPRREWLRMHRGASQLLFAYLPEKTVDWEEGAAIVRLETPKLTRVWTPEEARIVLLEVAELLVRWKRSGGRADDRFKSLIERKREMYTVGEADSIRASVLPTLYYCRLCFRVHFPKRFQLAKLNGEALKCRNCQKKTLRQYGIVFVHGCGHLQAVDEFIPSIISTNNTLIEHKYPIRCAHCRDKSDLVLRSPARSDRIKNTRIVCQECGQNVMESFFARCHYCFREAQRQAAGSQGMDSGGTLITKVKMRATSYRANDAYYPHTLTMLRLDNPPLSVGETTETLTLSRMIGHAQNDISDDSGSVIAELSRKLIEAQISGNKAEGDRIKRLIVEAANTLNNSQLSDMGPDISLCQGDEEHLADLRRMLEDSRAFRKTVKTTPAEKVMQGDKKGNVLLLNTVKHLCHQLGITEITTADNLPVINASFGFTRRSYKPTYDEDRQVLPTMLRAFPALRSDDLPGRNEAYLKGNTPILAREGKHEGIFFALDHKKVQAWLELNGIELPLEGQSPIVRIMHALEPVDRYHDNIEMCTKRRFVFGLVHTLSHMTMRVAGRYAGLERTSLAEYLFLPLLGWVIFDNSSNCQLGGLKLLLRDELAGFLRALEEEATACLYDPTCTAYKGACHGCIHSPEISCRFFNHGLSRVYLTGGHAPWADVASLDKVEGYWEV